MSVDRVRALVVALALVAMSMVAAGALLPAASTVAAAPDLGPFRGLGTWVDAYDYSPAFQANGGAPPVVAASIDGLRALGVRTLFLQAAKDDPRSPDPIVDRTLVGDLLVRAHREGLKVVAWYLPTFGDVTADAAHLAALQSFHVGKQRFDGYALDIEWTQGVTDVAERNKRVVDLAKQLRQMVGPTVPVAAIVYPAVQLEVLNQRLWPAFPYRAIAPYVDLWMPMTYWTFRDGMYRDAERYVTESVQRLRADLGDDKAVVHPIGGIGDLTTVSDLFGLQRAVATTGAIGWSIYDLNTTFTTAWPLLRAGRS